MTYRGILIYFFLILFGAHGKPLESFVLTPFIIKYEAKLGLPDGFYYTVQTSDGVNTEVTGKIDSKSALTVEGKYFLIAPDGTRTEVTYEADENGYRPHVVQTKPLVVSSPIPADCLISLGGGGCG